MYDDVLQQLLNPSMKLNMVPEPDIVSADPVVVQVWSKSDPCLTDDPNGVFQPVSFTAGQPGNQVPFDRRGNRK